MTKAKVIDLTAIDTVKGSNEGFDIKIYHPGTMVDLGITINVLGKDSDEFQKISRAQSKKRMSKMNRGGFRVQNVMIPPEEIEADGLELLAKCTKSWKTVAVKDKDGNKLEPAKETILVAGKEIEFSYDNALMIYERFPWIKEQVDAAVGDRANFIKS